MCSRTKPCLLTDVYLQRLLPAPECPSAVHVNVPPWLTSDCGPCGSWVTFSGFRSSPRANITLSGKKRRKLLKQLQHEQKTGMEGETCCGSSARADVSNLFSCSVESVTTPVKKKPEKKRKQQGAASVEDVEMVEVQPAPMVEVQQRSST